MNTDITTTTATATAVQGTVSLTELSQLFSGYVETDSACTLRTYKATIKRLFEFIHRNGITYPTRDDMRAYRDELKATLKPASVNLYMTGCRLFFQWLHQEGFCDTDITEHLKGSKIESGHKKDYLTASQVKNMLENVDGSDIASLRDKAMLRLMVTTGLRCVEVVRANVGDIRPLGNATVLYIQGKGRTEKSEFVKLTGKTETVLRAYLAARGTLAEEAPLFASTSNHSSADGRLTTRTVSGIVAKRLTDVNLKTSRLSAHSLRHTCATISLLNSEDNPHALQDVSALLRHKSIAVTQIYLHNIERATSHAEAVVDEAIENA